MVSEPPVTKTPSGRSDAPPGSRRATEIHIAKATKVVLWVAAIIGTLVFFLVWAKPIEVGRFLGAPTLLDAVARDLGGVRRRGAHRRAECVPPAEPGMLPLVAAFVNGWATRRSPSPRRTLPR
jgi:hypothetical protein